MFIRPYCSEIVEYTVANKWSMLQFLCEISILNSIDAFENLLLLQLQNYAKTECPIKVTRVNDLSLMLYKLAYFRQTVILVLTVITEI